MRFYNRTKEIAELKRIRERAFDDHSRLTVLVGRRRIGKTALILNALSDEPLIYLFVGRKSEADLCSGFAPEIERVLSVYVPTVDNFSDLFRFLLDQGVHKKFTLVIDEFQELDNVNSAIFSDIQNYWDQYRTKTNINFVVSGSIFSMMKRIFQDKKEPLFGRADAMMKINAFTTDTLKEIMAEYNPNYTNDELLALYTFTGGVPKYVELFVDNNSLTLKMMVKFICHNASPFIDEGRNLLIGEFGKRYGNYFSILDAISSGRNTSSQISDFVGDKSVGGQLLKLETLYEVISKLRPIFAKPSSQTVRYEVSDIFLRFWFRYIERNRSIVEIGNYELLAKIILEDYPTYSGHILERYFKEKMMESFDYRAIGSWWESRGEQYEVDIIGIHLDNKSASVIEVKRHIKNFKPQVLESKIDHLKTSVLHKYDIHSCCWTLEDM